MRSVHALLLAAGESRRCPPNKLLLPWGGSTVLESSADRLIASRAKTVLAVLGHQAEEALRLLASRRCRTVVNADYRQGMGSSLAAGVNALLAGGDLGADDGIMLCLGDEPFIPTALIDRLIGEFQDSGAGIVLPVRNGRRGHPSIFHRRYAAELLAASRSGGAREVVRAHQDELREVETSAEEILLDIDTMEDYLRCAHRAREARGQSGVILERENGKTTTSKSQSPNK